MGLAAITKDGYLHWQCYGGEEDEYCGASLSAHIDEAIYRESLRTNKPGRGAMIDLPQCACGALTSLKADYTLKELWHEVVIFVDELHRPQVYALPLQYTRNLRVHWMLYERGKATYAPVLPMPPQEVLEHPHAALIENPDGIYAMWFGFEVARQKARLLGSAKERILALLAERREE